MRVAKSLPVFKALEIVCKSIVELSKLKMQLCQKEVKFVDSLIIYPNVLEILDC